MQNRDAQDRAGYVDTRAALERLGGNRALYHKTLRLFLQSDEPQKLENSLAQQNYAAAALAAHSIKGMAANLSLPALHAQSTRLTQQLRQGYPLPQTLQAYRDTLRQTCEYIRQVLQQG